MSLSRFDTHITMTCGSGCQIRKAHELDVKYQNLSFFRWTIIWGPFLMCSRKQWWSSRIWKGGDSTSVDNRIGFLKTSETANNDSRYRCLNLLYIPPTRPLPPTTATSGSGHRWQRCLSCHHHSQIKRSPNPEAWNSSCSLSFTMCWTHRQSPWQNTDSWIIVGLRRQVVAAVKKMWCYQRKDTAATMVARPAESDPGGQEWPKRRKPTREGWIPGTGADVVTEEGHGQIASLPWPTHHKRKRRQWQEMTEW